VLKGDEAAAGSVFKIKLRRDGYREKEVALVVGTPADEIALEKAPAVFAPVPVARPRAAEPSAPSKDFKDDPY
jgi:hypothetical protein